jgi:hypothetical protein
VVRLSATLIVCLPNQAVFTPVVLVLTELTANAKSGLIKGTSLTLIPEIESLIVSQFPLIQLGSLYNSSRSILISESKKYSASDLYFVFIAFLPFIRVFLVKSLLGVSAALITLPVFLTLHRTQSNILSIPVTPLGLSTLLAYNTASTSSLAIFFQIIAFM